MTQMANGQQRQEGRGVGRVPPHSLEAEESLLGAMLLNREAIGAAVEAQLSSSGFYKPAHGHIYDVATTLYAQGEPIDPVTVAEMLRRAQLLDAVGGAATLISLQAGTPAIGNAARYARIVHEHSLLRRLIQRRRPDRRSGLRPAPGREPDHRPGRDTRLRRGRAAPERVGNRFRRGVE